MALSLLACRSLPPPTVTKIVEKPVPVQVPLSPTLARVEPVPARPPLKCHDAAGALTLCDSALADWLNAYDSALAAINDRMARIIGLQPKGVAK